MTSRNQINCPHSRIKIHCMIPYLVTILINCSVSSVLGSAVFETEEFTLAIVNVSGLGAFTGFASNFRDQVPGHAFGKVASLSGILIRAQSPAVNTGTEASRATSTDHNLDMDQVTVNNYDSADSTGTEGTIGGAKVNYLGTKELIQLAKDSRINFGRIAQMSIMNSSDMVYDGKPNVDKDQGMHTTTNDACEPIKLDWIPQHQWILLVQYGNCPDEIKLRHISQTNASAVLIYDNIPGHRLIKFAPPSKCSRTLTLSNEPRTID